MIWRALNFRESSRLRVFAVLLISRGGANREKLTVKKLIDNEMFFFFTVNRAFGKGVSDKAFHVEVPRGIPFEFCE